MRFDNIIQATMPWSPVVDDHILHDVTPFDAIKNGHWNAVPILIGADQHDARIFIWEAFNNTLPNWVKIFFTNTNRVPEIRYRCNCHFFPQDERCLGALPCE